MSRPVELAENGGEDLKPQTVDPKVWNTDSSVVPKVPDIKKDMSVVSGNELVVSSAFDSSAKSTKLSGPAQVNSESIALSSTTETLSKAQAKHKELEVKAGADLSTPTSLKPAPVYSEVSALPLKSTYQQNESSSLPPKYKSEAPAPIESSSVASDIVSKQFTLSKTERTVLPSVDLIETRNQDPSSYKQPVLQARIEHQDQTPLQIERQVERQVQPQRPEVQTLAESDNSAPRLLGRMQEVVQNTHNQPDLQIVDKANVPSRLEIASNAVIERRDNNSLSVQNAHSERPISARLEQTFAQATTIVRPNQDSIRYVSNPVNNTFLGFSRYVELNQIAASNTERAESAHRQVVPASFNIRALEVATRPLHQTFAAPDTASAIRSTYVANIVKSVLSGIQSNPVTDGQALSSGPRVNLDAQSIIKANFNPAAPGTIGNGAIVRGEFTVRDFRPVSANNSNMPSELRTDIRGQIQGVRPVELSFGKRKKKELFPGRRNDNTCAASRYISGLELGLIIALAGIAKFDSNDRSNRKVFNPNDSNQASTLDVSQFASSIGKSIENKKVKKRLPSYNWNNEWKAPGKIKVKNVLEKIKKERQDLKAKDLEKLESSSNAEELMSRLSKMVKQDQKALDSKHMLSSFSTRLQDKLKLNQNRNHNQPAQSISNYRPLWLVLENDSLTNLAEQIYQDSDVAWLIADMNISRVRETWMNNKRVIQLQSRQQIELPIQEDIDIFKQKKNAQQCAENLITVVIQNQLDKDHLNSQLQALQIKRKAFGST